MEDGTYADQPYTYSPVTRIIVYKFLKIVILADELLKHWGY